MTHLYARLSGALLLLLLLSVPAQAADTVPVDVVDGAVVWSPEVGFAQAMLTLSSPSGLEFRRAFGAGEAVRLHPSEMGDVPLADGFYEYRLLLAATIADADEPVEAVSVTGTIEVRAGEAVASALMDIQHLDDVIISFSLCVGNDCVNGESFGFDTIRMKENNIRIKAQDTSTSASFPSNDWQLTFNDSSNGGRNYFAVDDITGSRTPFLVEAGARTNALYVESDGDIGIGTPNPVVNVHVVTGNTPTVRLDQDGSSGFTPQIWDVAGNEANFFIRDATNGSALPFRISPGNNSNLIHLRDNAVGINTSSPGNTARLVIDADATSSPRIGLKLDGVVDGTSLAADIKGAVDIDGSEITDASIPALKVQGSISATSTIFASTQFGSIFDPAQAAAPLFIAPNTTFSPILSLSTSGNLTISGTYSPASDVNMKENISPVDVDAILAGVVALPISTWEYIADPEDALHLGPMAQDFSATFGLGENDTTIATIDSDGVALAAIQALHARAEAATARVAELEAANAALEARLARLEALLGADHE